MDLKNKQIFQRFGKDERVKILIWRPIQKVLRCNKHENQSMFISLSMGVFALANEAAEQTAGDSSDTAPTEQGHLQQGTKMRQV